MKPENLEGNKVKISDSLLLHQITAVLRMRKNDEFIVLDGEGNEFLCRLSNLTAGEAAGEIIEKRKNAAEPEIKVNLFQALPKKAELFEWVLQKGAEIGVSTFTPIITQRTERTSLPKIDRLLRILKEAAEQSGRGVVPKMFEIKKFEDCVPIAPENEKSGKISIMLHNESERELLSSDIKCVKEFSECDIFIGPEGGFSESEISLAEKSGQRVFSLGPRILRMETAAIASASLILL